jgi:hypothetical protein
VDFITQRSQVTSYSQRSRTAANQGYLFSIGLKRTLVNPVNNIAFKISGNPFEPADGHWFFFNTASSTGWFTRAIASSAQYPRKYVGFPIDHIGVVIAAQSDHADVLRYGSMSRTRVLTIDYFMKILGIRKIGRFQIIGILFGSMVKNRVKNT